MGRWGQRRGGGRGWGGGGAEFHPLLPARPCCCFPSGCTCRVVASLESLLKQTPAPPQAALPLARAGLHYLFSL